MLNTLDLRQNLGPVQCDHACKFRGNLKKHLLKKHKFSDDEATEIMKGVSKSQI